MIEAFVLAFALAIDSAAVAAARGLLRVRGELVVLPLLFGGFQAGMAALGWVVGRVGGRYVEAFDHWIAFGLLTLIGGKMIFDTWRDKASEQPERRAGIALYLLLALATSIDAAAAGITLPLVPVSAAVSLSAIGVVTAACSLAGYLVGNRFGGGKLAYVGGVILIALGIRILVEHL